MGHRHHRRILCDNYVRWFICKYWPLTPSHFWWLVRVTLVVALGLLPQRLVRKVKWSCRGVIYYKSILLSIIIIRSTFVFYLLCRWCAFYGEAFLVKMKNHYLVLKSSSKYYTYLFHCNLSLVYFRIVSWMHTHTCFCFCDLFVLMYFDLNHSELYIIIIHNNKYLKGYLAIWRLFNILISNIDENIKVSFEYPPKIKKKHIYHPQTKFGAK